MLNKIKISILAAALISVVSCELPDNIDPKHPIEAPAENIFTNAQKEIADVVSTMDYNINASRLLAQYASEVTYTNESRYNFSDRSIPDNFWNELYSNSIINLEEVKNLLSEITIGTDEELAVRDNKILIADVLQVYGYHLLVDAFGDVPYTEALKLRDDVTPGYDDAATIYTDLISRLSTAITSLDDSYDSYGSADVIYGGDVSQWKLFAASLKLRLGMRINNRAAIESAAAAGVITDAADNAEFFYTTTSPNVHSFYNWYVERGRKDFAPTNTIVDILLSLNDPRLPLWVTMVDTNAVKDGVGDIYLGLPYGKDGSSGYNSFSHMTAPFFAADFSMLLIDAAEVHFLLAEAAARTYTVVGTAEEHYDEAITASILYWGGSQGDANSYLAQPEVAYTTAAGTFQQKIGTQKWISLYDRGIEGWTEWRRLGWPVLNKPASVSLTYADIPNRMPYPFSEKQLNGASYDAAVAKTGVDNAARLLFWDPAVNVNTK